MRVVTEGTREQGGGIGGMSHLTLLFALVRVVGWLIVTVYVVSVFIGYWRLLA